MDGIKLEFFKKEEFGDWWDDMSIRQLIMLDQFRRLIGRPCHISPHPDALGRRLGKKSQSQHNIDVWGTVRATDIFVDGLTRDEVPYAFECAVDCGFSGIGFYFDTTYKGEKAIMMHLDCREDRTSSDPAKWARVGGEYVSLDTFINRGLNNVG